MQASVPHKGSGGLYQASFANTSNNSNDTIVYIPLVLNGDSTVNGFIRATINDSITVSFSLARDYKNYSFNSSGQNKSEATKFAFFMMYLNREVFGNEVYNISDPRLFSNDTINRKTAKIFFSEPHNNTSNLEDFVEICETVNVQLVNCKYVGYPQCTPVCDQCGKCMSTA